MTKKSPTWIQRWSQEVSKSIKNLLTSKSGPQVVLLGIRGGLRINKMVPQDTKITPREVKMQLPGVRKAIPGSQNGATNLSDSQPTVGTVAGCKQLDMYIYIYTHISADPSWRRACWISSLHRQSTNQQSNQHIAHGTVPSLNKSTKQPAHST